MGGLIVGIILILIGLSALTGIPFFGIIFAIFLIAIGVRMISRRSVRGGWHWDDRGYGAKTASGSRTIDEVAVFGPLNRSYSTEHFNGGKIVMVFSGGEIDLSQVKTDLTEIDLEISSVFSGAGLIIPKDWKIKSNANIFLGGVDTSKAQGGDGNVTLVIHGEAVFGGIEVKK
jgi:predicted membrane protein